ncbi:MAG TPA: hypothetical protein VF796_18760, partial [Humisphaera sp.]
MRVKSSVSSKYLSLTFPLTTVSEPNRRDHWGKRRRRGANQQQVVGWELAAFRPSIAAVGLPVRVTLTRIAPERTDPDNLGAGFKAVQDAVAKVLNVDDGDPRVTWVYDQEHQPRGRSVRIEFES